MPRSDVLEPMNLGEGDGETFLLRWIKVTSRHKPEFEEIFLAPWVSVAITQPHFWKSGFIGWQFSSIAQLSTPGSAGRLFECSLQIRS